MSEPRRFLRTVLTIPLTIAMTTAAVFAAPAYDAPVNETNAMALLKEYDPDGYYIVQTTKQMGSTGFSSWLQGSSNNAEALDTAVHEECHEYTHTKNDPLIYTDGGWLERETIYVGNGMADIIVPFLFANNTVYKTENFTKTIPESMRTFRYDDYVAEGSELSSNQEGIYGLLNEYNAYSWGMNNQMMLYPYYKANNTYVDYFNACANGYQAYEEFRYWTLGLLNHERKNAPDQYKVHMNNIDLVNAYCITTTRFRTMIEEFKKNAAVMTDSNTRDYTARLEYDMDWRGITMLENASAAAELKAIEEELFASATIGVNLSEEQIALMTEFVTRLYNLCLQREPDENGLKYWVNRLKSGQMSAAQVVQGFFFSKEMQNLNLDHEEYVERCYEVMMNRGSDSGGKKYWVERLNNGVTRMYVVRGFVESPEFTAIAAKYGIKRGSLKLGDVRDQNYGITSFVARCYTKALGRSYDESGLKTWVSKILNASNRKQAAIDTASNGFLHSAEFQNKKLNDTEYVKVLYRTFLDREYDAAGLADWTDRLQKGSTRDEVMKGFAGSVEFAKLMERYGIR
ncbi:MAG: DUF4214 domain-containing protein [Solobacterium sp.]|nr:DUF4214 domain-containing protein [Solobacterium sp.]